MHQHLIYELIQQYEVDIREANLQRMLQRKLAASTHPNPLANAMRRTISQWLVGRGNWIHEPTALPSSPESGTTGAI